MAAENGGSDRNIHLHPSPRQQFNDRNESDVESHSDPAAPTPTVRRSSPQHGLAAGYFPFTIVCNLVGQLLLVVILNCLFFEELHILPIAMTACKTYSLLLLMDLEMAFFILEGLRARLQWRTEKAD